MRITVCGVEVWASFWFFALIACFAVLDREVLALYFALPVAVHELGHLVVMAVCRVRIRSIHFTALGVDIRRGSGVALPYSREAAISFGGIAANALLALCLRIFCFQSMRMMFLVSANIAVALFNLLPIADLDGGQLVRLATERFFAPDTARTVSRIASVAVLALLIGFVFFLLSIRWCNPTLLIACAYLAFNVLLRD